MTTSVGISTIPSLRSDSREDGDCGLVVGVDGSVKSIAALNTAAAIGRARRCPLHAVSVLQPYPSRPTAAGPVSSQVNADDLRKRLRESELAEIVRALEPGYNWTHEVVIGRAARELVSVAENHHADLLVLGRRAHSRINRLLGGETTLQVMQTCSVPVLAVESEIERVHTAVAGIDFSSSSLRAAQRALDLIKSFGAGTLYLVFVEQQADLISNEFMLPLEARFPGDVIVWFRRLTSSLGPHQGIHVQTTVLAGSTVRALSDFADRVGAQLIAAGSHSHGRLGRFLLGSVSTGLVRNARCSVLVAPPADVPDS